MGRRISVSSVTVVISQGLKPTVERLQSPSRASMTTVLLLHTQLQYIQQLWEIALKGLCQNPIDPYHISFESYGHEDLINMLTLQLNLILKFLAAVEFSPFPDKHYLLKNYRFLLPENIISHTVHSTINGQFS
jgi:hypothetical protein